MELMKIDYTCVPDELASYVLREGLVKPFMLLLYLKLSTSGIFNDFFLNRKQICQALGISDIRTINKYLLKLIQLGWLGYNASNGNYWIRSYRAICRMLLIKTKKLICVWFDDLKHLKYLLSTGLISLKLKELDRKRKYYLKKRAGQSALKKGNALPIAKSLGLRDYFGLSNSQIAKLLGCSKSEANRIKLRAIELNYMIANKKNKFIVATDDIYTFFKMGYMKNSERYFTQLRNGKVFLYERQTDELICFVHTRVRH